MAIVKGEGVILQFEQEGSLIPFGCARSITVNMNTDTIGKSTIGSGNWKEFEAVAKGWDFTCEGIVYLLTNLTAPDIYDMWDKMQPVTIMYILIDESGNDVHYSGEALITGVSTNGAVNNVSSINITGQGTGELMNLQLFEITGVVVHADPVNTVDITFDFNPYPGASIYVIEITDITLNSAYNDIGGEAPRTISGLPSAHTYSFRLINDIVDDFTDYIYYP